MTWRQNKIYELHLLHSTFYKIRAQYVVTGVCVAFTLLAGCCCTGHLWCVFIFFYMFYLCFNRIGLLTTKSKKEN